MGECLFLLSRIKISSPISRRRRWLAAFCLGPKINLPKRRKTQIENAFPFHTLDISRPRHFPVNGKENSTEWKYQFWHTHTYAHTRDVALWKILFSLVVSDDQWARHAQWPTERAPMYPRDLVPFTERGNDSIFAFNLRQWTFLNFQAANWHWLGRFSAAMTKNFDLRLILVWSYGNLWINMCEKFLKKIA